MYNMKKHVTLLLWINLQASATQTFRIDDSPPGAFRTFKAIHSALRLWDSALDHNGMTCFMATIPQNVRLYHGSNTNTVAKGLTWFAFDIQHALMFTKAPATQSFATSNETRDYASVPQVSLNGQPHVYEDVEFGWQHEYATNRDLRVLYFDGLSAAKTTMGTLDMQELLLNRSKNEARISDSLRAQNLCDLLRKEWKAEVDGLIRMEHGIEIILCQAEETLVPIRIAKRRVPSSRWKSMFSTAGGLTEYFRTAFARDKDFGRSKAIIDFDSMVSGLSHLSKTAESSRLFDLSPEIVDELRADVKNMVQSGAKTFGCARKPRDWQAITDIIVSHYSDMLQRLTSIDTVEIFVEELEAILFPFLEDHEGFPVINTMACASQYFPSEFESSTAAEAIQSVSTAICKTLAHVKGLKGDLAASQAILNNLIIRLDWNAWKGCGDCALGEFCWTPVWPLGTVTDRTKPSCRSAVTVEFENRYWK